MERTQGLLKSGVECTERMACNCIQEVGLEVAIWAARCSNGGSGGSERIGT